MTDLPKGWEWSTLENLAASDPRSMTDGPFGSNLKSSHYVSAGPRVIRLQNIGFGEFVDERAHITEEHFDTLRKHEVVAGDLLVASLGENLPRSCIAPESIGPAIVKADCIRVRLHPEMDRQYVNYALQRPAIHAAVKEQIHGVGRPRLGMAGIRQLTVPLPSQAEQQRIVAAIEENLSRLEAAEAALVAASDRADALIRSVRSSVADGTWPRTRLRDLADTQLGKMLSAKSRSGVGTTPYLRNRNVRWGSFDLTEVALMDFSSVEQDKFRLQPGDVLVCEGGAGVGRAAVWQGDLEGTCYQKALHRIRTGPEILPAFLAEFIRFFVESGRLEQDLSGVAIGHWPQEDIRELLVPTPSIGQQADWLERLAAVSAVVAHAHASTRRAQLRARHLRRSILAAAVSGQLVPQNPADEPASALLKRIQAERDAQPKRGRARKVTS